MKKLSEATKRNIIFLIGMSIIQFGVALFLIMYIGSDPFTVFTQGLANTLNNLGVNATTGTANRIILIVLFSIILKIVIFLKLITFIYYRYSSLDYLISSTSFYSTISY